MNVESIKSNPFEGNGPREPNTEEVPAPPAEVTLYNPHNLFPWDMTLGSSEGVVSIGLEDDPWTLKRNNEQTSPGVVGTLLEYGAYCGFRDGRDSILDKDSVVAPNNKFELMVDNLFSLLCTSTSAPMVVSTIVGVCALAPFGLPELGLATGMLAGLAYGVVSWLKGYSRGVALGEYEEAQLAPMKAARKAEWDAILGR